MLCICEGILLESINNGGRYWGDTTQGTQIYGEESEGLHIVWNYFCWEVS